VLVLTFATGRLDLPKRVTRTLVIGSVAFAVAAFQLVPMVLDESLINHSRWEPQWKWDSFGALNVYQMLVRGDLLDFGRLPVLSVLALLGAVVCIVKIHKGETHRFLVAGGVLWLVLFCGRPALGVLFTMLGGNQLPLHRLIGGVHTFAFFFIGIGLSTVWKWCLGTSFAYRKTIATGLTALLLFPVVSERGSFHQRNKEWSEMNLAALDIEKTDVDAAVSAINASSGRAYSGKAATWGQSIQSGKRAVLCDIKHSLHSGSFFFVSCDGTNFRPEGLV